MKTTTAIVVVALASIIGGTAITIYFASQGVDPQDALNSGMAFAALPAIVVGVGLFLKDLFLN
jgi:hypothetical protein